MKRKTFASLSQSRHGGSLGKPFGLIFLLGVVFVLAVTQTAHGQDLDSRKFTARGFGTLAATTQDADDLEFRRNVGQSSGVAAGDVEFATDSLVGLQFDARLGSHFDVLAQGVTRQRADGDWSPEITQAFVRYTPDESLVLRAGRIGYDIYLLAESRQVGYSYLALRPSLEFYGVITNDRMDGGDISYSQRLGSALVRARVFGGGGSGELAFADRTHAGTTGTVYGATFDYVFRGWMARAAYVSFGYDGDASFPQLAAALRLTGAPESLRIADDIDHDEFSSWGLQLGIAYDDGPLQAQILYGTVTSESITGPDVDKFYSLVGYRMRQWMPFVSFATSKDRNPYVTAGLPDIAMLAPLNDAVHLIQQNNRSTQRSVSVGVRYDFASHFDLKLQVDRVSLRDSSLMFDRRVPPGGNADMTVIAAAVDFVF
jgi:hypothetical protein